MTTSMITKICITFSTLAAVAVWAGPSQAQTSCNNSTIKGTYAALATAWTGTPPDTPFFGLRWVHFDGAGNFNSTGWKTNTTPPPTTFGLTGVYTVSADCTMMQAANSSGAAPTFFRVIAADSNKIYQIRTDTGWESIVFERVESNQNAQ
jgi:hypothetical protein